MSDEEKTVFCVRHAQSLQNVATARFMHGDVGALGELLRIGYDAELSTTGDTQLQEAAHALAGFKAHHGVELFAHSPYQRAKATAHALFGGPFHELHALHERSMSEYFLPSGLDIRVDQVKRWLDGRAERVIVLVGHGQWFKRALGLAHVQPNVSIVKASYSATKGFTNPQAVYDGFPDYSADPVPHAGAPPVESE